MMLMGDSELAMPAQSAEQPPDQQQLLIDNFLMLFNPRIPLWEFWEAKIHLI